MKLIKYDKIFVSSIFPTAFEKLRIKTDNEIHYGGTGFDLSVKLPNEIDNCDCDYSLYPDCETSYGFITRGCIRKCKFCFVPKKEGKLHFYNSLDKIIRPQHKQVKFMDNNFLAYDGHKEVLQEIIDRKIRCQFNQGLDIRLFN